MKQLIIKPAYYSDGNVPVFKPTEEQFKDFSLFIQATLPYGQKAGIYKVIPPPNWNGNKMDIESKLKKITIKRPIQQNFFGNGGIFKQTNIESRKAFTIDQFRRLCSSPDFRPPSPNSGTTNRKAVSIGKRKNKKCTSSSTATLNSLIPLAGEESNQILTPPGTICSEVSQDKIDPLVSALNNDLVSSEVNSEYELATKRTIKRRPLTSIDSLIKEQTVVPTIDQSIYTPEFLKETERNFWRNIAFVPPYYGADLSGSLFSKNVKSWNPQNLKDLLHQIGTNLPGVNTPYLYFGMWRATFAWHVEDMDLFSINYIHQGAPKQWYSIPPEHKSRFERAMQGLFTSDFKKCSQFLRHKTFMVSPSILANHCIPVNKVTHFEGEFMITFPNGYHSGYNLGFNVAESINFATDYWIDIGKSAKACQCIKDSVSIDMHAFGDTTQGPKKRTRKEDSIPIFNTLVSGKERLTGKPDSASRLTRSKVKKHVKGKKRTIQSVTSLLSDEKEVIKKLAKERKPYLVTSGYIEFEPTCSLCRKVEGTLIKAENGLSWAHPRCAVFVPGIEAKERSGIYVFSGIDQIPACAWKEKCYRCHRMGGVCVKCSLPSCHRRFHISCVHPDKMFRGEDGKNTTYCATHGPKVIPPVIEAPWKWPRNFQYSDIKQESSPINLIDSVIPMIDLTSGIISNEVTEQDIVVD